MMFHVDNNKTHQLIDVRKFSSSLMTYSANCSHCGCTFVMIYDEVTDQKLITDSVITVVTDYCNLHKLIYRGW